MVHPYTFRSENVFLPLELRATPLDNPAQMGDAQAEDMRFFALGVAGLFTDFPNVGVKARQVFHRETAKP